MMAIYASNAVMRKAMARVLANAMSAVAIWLVSCLAYREMGSDVATD